MPNTEKILEDKKDHIAYSPEVNLIRPILAKYMNEWSADMLGELAKIFTESVAQALAEDRERIMREITREIFRAYDIHSFLINIDGTQYLNAEMLFHILASQDKLTINNDI